MPTPILTTKLYIPSPRPNAVHRPRLIELLNEGLHRKLTLISAPAGFGKTTLVSSWIDDVRLKIDDWQKKNGRSHKKHQSPIINQQSIRLAVAGRRR